MENEIIELKEEMNILNERISALEKSNNHRKAYAYTKALIKICLILLSIYGIWRGYQYVTSELPKLVDEKIKEINPIKS